MSALNDQLLAAAIAGDLAGVQEALIAGADVHYQNGYALQMSARHGHLGNVQCLVEAGANLHARNDLALRWAAEHGHLAIVEYLLAAGADVQADNNLALKWSSNMGHDGVVRLLLDQGASLGSILPGLARLDNAVQVAALARGDIRDLTVFALSRRGVCPDALCTLIERQGHPGLSAMLSATQMLEPLTSDARAEILSEFLAQQRDRSDRAEVLQVLLPAELNQ